MPPMTIRSRHPQRAATNTAPADIEQALVDLGIEVTGGDDDEVKGRCPYHEFYLGKQDGKPSWSVNRLTGVHNCLGGETRVITRDGTRAIAELAGTTAHLLTSRGWRHAPVYNYGQQQLYRVVLSRNGVKKTIRATADHRWFIQVSRTGGGLRKKEVTTLDLMSGNRISDARAPRSGTLQASPYGQAHGVVFGDGTLTQRGTSRANLCGNKDFELEHLFPWGTHTRLENQLSIDGLPRHWKQFPPKDEAPTYLYGFISGWFAADGCVDEHGHASIASSKAAHLEWLRDVCTRLGIVTYGIRVQNRKGIDARYSKIYSVSFMRSTLTEDFFLTTEHHWRWSKNKTVKERIGWVVEGVYHDYEETVYCAEVPETHDFVLEDNILTGNCFSCPYQGTFQSLVSDMLDIGPFDASRWIRNYGLNMEQIENLPEYEERRERTKRSKEVEESDLLQFVRPPVEALELRSISAEAARHYGILWDPKWKSWILPIRMPDGTLIGWQSKGEKRMRSAQDVVLNHPLKMLKSLTLFGADVFPRGHPAVIQESPLDCARILTAGLMGAMATFGDKFSDEQMRVLRDLTDEVVWGTDDDEAGRMAARLFRDGDRKTKRPAYARRFRARFLDYGMLPPGCKDVGERGVEDIHIERAIRGAKHVLLADLGESNVHGQTAGVPGTVRKASGKSRVPARGNGTGNRKNPNNNRRSRGAGRRIR